MEEEKPKEKPEEEKPKPNDAKVEDNKSEFLSKKEEVSEAHKDLMAMGFPEEKVKLALRAAWNNRERAVDYLINVIPIIPFKFFRVFHNNFSHDHHNNNPI